MRIVHVIKSLDPADGGPPMIAARLAAAQAAAKHEVHMVCYQSQEERERVRAALDPVPGFLKAVNVHTVSPDGRFERVFASRARYLLKNMFRQPCAVHLHGVWDSILRVAGQEARRAGRPYFILLNGMLDPWSLTQRAWKKKLALRLGYRRLLNGASALHLGNEDERRLIEPLQLLPAKYILPNGVFFEELEPLPPAGSFYDRHPGLRQRPFVLFLSRLHYKKGLDYLAEAFAQVAAADPQVALVVAGPDGGEREPFVRRIASQGLSDRVLVPGPLYGRDKLAALVDACCFCLPSRQEGFSMAITEALACRVPAVVSEACHFPEVTTAGAGAVVRLDASDLAAALLRFIQDPAARIAAGEAGRSLIASKYTWPKIAESAVEMYLECRVAAGPSSSAPVSM